MSKITNLPDVMTCLSDLDKKIAQDLARKYGYMRFDPSRDDISNYLYQHGNLENTHKSLVDICNNLFEINSMYNNKNHSESLEAEIIQTSITKIYNYAETLCKGSRPGPDSVPISAPISDQVVIPETAPENSSENTPKEAHVLMQELVRTLILKLSLNLPSELVPELSHSLLQALINALIQSQVPEVVPDVVPEANPEIVPVYSPVSIPASVPDSAPAPASAPTHHQSDINSFSDVIFELNQLSPHTLTQLWHKYDLIVVPESTSQIPNQLVQLGRLKNDQQSLIQLAINLRACKNYPVARKIDEYAQIVNNTVTSSLNNFTDVIIELRNLIEHQKGQLWYAYGLINIPNASFIPDELVRLGKIADNYISMVILAKNLVKIGSVLTASKVEQYTQRLEHAGVSQAPGQ